VYDKAEAYDEVPDDDRCESIHSVERWSMSALRPKTDRWRCTKNKGHEGDHHSGSGRRAWPNDDQGRLF
jgi:hypothetical protein